MMWAHSACEGRPSGSIHAVAKHKCIVMGMSAVGDKGLREPLRVERLSVFGVCAKPKRMERGVGGIRERRFRRLAKVQGFRRVGPSESLGLRPMRCEPIYLGLLAATVTTGALDSIRA
jgi:hypothetical protein